MCSVKTLKYDFAKCSCLLKCLFVFRKMFLSFKRKLLSLKGWKNSRIQNFTKHLFKIGTVRLNDNAPAHTAGSVRRFLAQKQVPVLNHPPYSPDLAPADYFLFPKLKLHLKGTKFETIEDIHKVVTDELKEIPYESFSNAMKKMKTRAELCIQSNGSYFE